MPNRMLRWMPVAGIGLEHLELTEQPGGITARSTVIGSFNDRDFGASYEMHLDSGWVFRSLRLDRSDGKSLTLESDGSGGWSRPGFERCVDIDIGVTPFTNTLPIHRTRFAPNVPQHFHMAWIPLDTLEPFVDEQIYTMRDKTHFHYAAADGSFEADLTVDADGLVLDYPGLYRRI
jgi:uncharacterized protein